MRRVSYLIFHCFLCFLIIGDSLDCKVQGISPGVLSTKATSQSHADEPSLFRELLWEKFRYLNGIMLSSILYVFSQPNISGKNILGLFGDSARPKEVHLREILSALPLEHPERVKGNILGALHTLALHGWLVEREIADQTTFEPTELGSAIFQLVQYLSRQIPLDDSKANPFDEVFQTLTVLPDPRIAFYHSAPETSDRALNAYQKLVELDKIDYAVPDISGSLWGETEATPRQKKIQERAKNQLIKSLRGLLMGYTMVGLGFPPYGKSEAEAVFSHFDRETGILSLSLLKGKVHEEFVRAALEFLQNRELIVTMDGQQDTFQWTRAGENMITNAHIVGTPTAYIRGLSQLVPLMYVDGNHDGILQKDGLVYRVTDADASRKTHGRYWEKAFSIIRDFFNSMSLQEQPMAIIGLGSGTGGFEEYVGKQIVNGTRRGESLDNFPLVIIGSEYSSDLIKLVEENLRKFKQNLIQQGQLADEALRVHACFGDVTQPKEFDSKIQGVQIPITDPITKETRILNAKDGLYLLSFVFHELGPLVSSVEEAEKIMREAVEEIYNNPAKRRFLQSFKFREMKDRELPEDLEEIVSLVKNQFTVSFSDGGALVHPWIAAASYIRLAQGWRDKFKHGAVIIELHIPRPQELEEEVPEDPNQPTKAERGLYAAYFFPHVLSAQIPLPFPDYLLAMLLGGLAPEGEIIVQPKKETGPASISIALFRPIGAGERGAMSGSVLSLVEKFL